MHTFDFFKAKYNCKPQTFIFLCRRKKMERYKAVNQRTKGWFSGLWMPLRAVCQAIFYSHMCLQVTIASCKQEMGPDLTQAYFWPAENKRPTRLRLGYFPTRRDFFWLEGKKIEKFDIFKGNFPNSNPNHIWLTQPKPQKIDPTRVKNFWPGPITTANNCQFPLKLPTKVLCSIWSFPLMITVLPFLMAAIPSINYQVLILILIGKINTGYVNSVYV